MNIVLNIVLLVAHERDRHGLRAHALARDAEGG